MDEIENIIANISAIADAERKMKEEFLEDRNKANEIVRNFHNRFCNDFSLASPSSTVETRSAVDIVNSLITDVRVVIAQLNQQIKKENIEELEKEISRLSLENDSLKEEIKIIKTQETKTGSVDDNYVKNLFASLSSPVQKSKPNSEPEPKKPTTGNISDPNETQILQIAGNSKAIKVESLIEECKSRTGLSDTIIKNSLQNLDDEALLIIEKTEIKPTAKGVVYADIFRLTPEGMKLTGAGKSELDCWIDQNKGITYQEVPLILYAVEEFLPKHGYTLVDLFKEIPYTFKNGKTSFIPHIHLKNERDANIYVMFEGAGTRGESIHEYFDDYYEFTNGDMYFLCPNGKVARSVEGAVKYHKKNAAKITNIADWAIYDQMLVSGNKVPATIWFTQMREISNGTSRSAN